VVDDAAIAHRVVVDGSALLPSGSWRWRLADAVIRGAVERDARCDQLPQRVGERSSIRVADGDVVQAGVAGRRRRAIERLPGVQPDVVVVAAGADERGLLAVALLQLEPEHAGPEVECAVEVGHLQMDVPDVDTRVDRRGTSLRRVTFATAIDATRCTAVIGLGLGAIENDNPNPTLRARARIATRR
jgi:hypothetical protein